MATPSLPIAPMRTPIFKPQKSGTKILDLRPSKSLATGLKRVGGRKGFSRLGQRQGVRPHGKAIIMHKY